MVKLILVVRTALSHYSIKGSAKPERKGEPIKLYNSGFLNFI